MHLEVAGRVQGVGFRWFVRETARRSDLAGWVRNVEGGRVEIAASGSEAAIAALVSAARQGPPGAQVDSVAELSTAGLEHLPRPFTVLR